jgi:hypothetical protein
MRPENGLLIIVRRGATEWLEHRSARLGGEEVRIRFDLRVAERRQKTQRPEIERRRGDRRRPPPLTWPTGGFVVARVPTDSAT